VVEPFDDWLAGDPDAAFEQWCEDYRDRRLEGPGTDDPYRHYKAQCYIKVPITNEPTTCSACGSTHTEPTWVDPLDKCLDCGTRYLPPNAKVRVLEEG
jgi:hypothetical protein